MIVKPPKTAASLLFCSALILVCQPVVLGKRVEIKLSEGTTFAASLSPDGKSIAIDLHGIIWVLAASGGQAKQLTDGFGDDRLPTWSPDSKRIAFQSYRSGNWDIWSIAADGSQLKQHTHGPADDREPDWSPDGSRIAFSSDRSGNYDIWVLTLSTGFLEKITEHEGNDYMPAWAPDANRIAFISDRRGPGTADVWWISLAPRVERQLTTLDGQANSPGWRPDGRQIIFNLVRGRESKLYTVWTEEGAPAPLIEGEDVFPFRPNWTRENKIIYTADGKIKRRAFPVGDKPEIIEFEASLAFDRPTYKRRKAILGEGQVNPVKGIVRPVLSPDGKKVAFSALGDIWILKVGGGKPSRFTSDPGVETDPCWSPDGEKIAYASDLDGTMDIWIKSLKDGKARKVTNLPSSEFGPAWSPDGTRIAFLTHAGDLNVVNVYDGEIKKVRSRLFSPDLPTWSSDGRHIALCVLKPNSSRFREGTNRILVISLADNKERFLSKPEKSIGARDGTGPVWSPDGRFMAFIMDGSLWVMPVKADGQVAGQPRKLNDEPSHFPSWSGDSKRLLYLALDPKYRSPRLRLLSLEDGKVRDFNLSLSYRVKRPSGRLVIRAGRLIDGTAKPPQENVDITIDGNRILRIERSSSEPLKLAPGVRFIDARDKIVMPGLIEMHTHPNTQALGSALGRIFLGYGITSVRVPGAPAFQIIQEKEIAVSGLRPGPRVFTTGHIFDGSRIYYSGLLSIDDLSEAKLELSRAWLLGYDLIKTYVRLPDLLQKFIIEQAHVRGIPVTSHEIYPAVALGADGIEHVRGTSRRGFSPKVSSLGKSYSDVIELIAKSQVYFTPTLQVMGGFALALIRDPKLAEDPKLGALFPAWAAEQVKSSIPRVSEAERREREETYGAILETVGKIARSGGRIVAGTDSPLVPYGLSLHVELEHMVEAGMTPMEAIVAATSGAAECLGASDQLGTIEPGKLADLVILDGDPLVDIRNTRKIWRVIKDGEEFSVERLSAAAFGGRK